VTLNLPSTVCLGLLHTQQKKPIAWLKFTPTVNFFGCNKPIVCHKLLFLLPFDIVEFAVLARALRIRASV